MQKCSIVNIHARIFQFNNLLAVDNHCIGLFINPAKNFEVRLGYITENDFHVSRLDLIALKSYKQWMMREMSNLTFKRYLQTVQFSKLLKELGVQNVEALTEQVQHFTEKEAEKRDEIVLSYFGTEGVQRIIDSVADRLLSLPRFTENAAILDVGAGTGFFTIKIAQKLRKDMPNASFYAMDITPAMLRVLVKKTTDILPFLGTAENISASIKFARKHLEIPERFDAVYSTLTLHHCLDIEKVFRSIHEALKTNGKAVIVDLCEHPFKEFKKEMGDIHLGFRPEQIKEKASKYFSKVQIEKMSGICCESSGRSAELFIAYMVT